MMRKKCKKATASVLTCLILILLLCLPAAAAQETEGGAQPASGGTAQTSGSSGANLAAREKKWAQVTAQDVNLRTLADRESASLMVLPLNAQVEVLGEVEDWFRVEYEGVIGYIRRDYAFLSEGSRAAYVTSDGVRLRGGPDRDAYVIRALYAGQGVTIKQMIGEWYFVLAGDEKGYVHRNYLTMTAGSGSSGDLLRVGMEGEEVRRLQKELCRRGFLSEDDVTGSYGAKTRAAVADFQKGSGLASADGIAGLQTLTALYDNTNKVTRANAIANQVKGSVILLDWFKGGSDWLYRYSKFTVVDVRTGLKFRARRFGGWYHADCEPLTASDSAVIKEMAGGEWSWDRRPIWVMFDGKVVAASMHCMPHMVSPTESNNFPGHFCIHLLNSKVHETSRACPRHQACVQEAYRAGNPKAKEEE